MSALRPFPQGLLRIGPTSGVFAPHGIPGTPPPVGRLAPKPAIRGGRNLTGTARPLGA